METRMHGFELEVRNGDIPADYNEYLRLICLLIQIEATEGGINDGDRRSEYRSKWKSEYLTL